MTIKYLTITESKIAYNAFIEAPSSFSPELDEDYMSLRKDLVQHFNVIRAIDSKPYQLDYRFSLWFYDYIRNKEWFNNRLASNYEFWNYIALKVMPDLIFIRFNQTGDAKHYYNNGKGLRIWPYTLYWYSHLSWQGDKESTEELLSSKRCNTDTILNLVERPGSRGTFLKLYRKIMYYFIHTDTNDIDFIPTFRNIMVLALAKTIVINPDFIKGGEDALAKQIVEEIMLK